MKDGNKVVMKFRVDKAEAGREVVWTCSDNGNPIWPGTTLTWKIDGGSKTKVTFTHSGFKEAESPPYQMTAGGWQHFMSSLTSYLNEGAGQPW